MIGINSLIIVAVLVLQTADGFTWTSPDGVTGFVRAALPDAPAALPTERNAHAAVAVDSDLLIVGGESNTELVQEMCMIDTEQQVTSQLNVCVGPKTLWPASVFASCKCYLHMTTSQMFPSQLPLQTISHLALTTCGPFSHSTARCLPYLTGRVRWPGWSQS